MGDEYLMTTTQMVGAGATLLIFAVLMAIVRWLAGKSSDAHSALAARGDHSGVSDAAEHNPRQVD